MKNSWSSSISKASLKIMDLKMIRFNKPDNFIHCQEEKERNKTYGWSWIFKDRNEITENCKPFSKSLYQKSARERKEESIPSEIGWKKHHSQILPAVLRNFISTPLIPQGPLRWSRVIPYVVIRSRTRWNPCHPRKEEYMKKFRKFYFANVQHHWGWWIARPTASPEGSLKFFLVISS